MNAAPQNIRPRSWIGSISRDALCSMWRGSAQTVHERLRFFKQDGFDEETAETYLDALRRVSEAEAELDFRGIEYARSGDDWREDDGIKAAVWAAALGAV